ncbi:xanthine dehydrogenase accessory protein XdhC [Nesterenkonia sp. HG001]|uniref:xanthine dehydrogenase accessory protein XdhC n=1 Tax=Nesterenkonia sp. HG001 TaxID=2983207 RepID=UPI002AC70952|nr:xanthine dehydrogenase accessory protein XdhC [Nesterenkonia sp. HG001]MDZ5078831.1 xanthine dehydrogenase accessory protein XdhC [Nesterenkonia sp. HG001]
MDWHAAIGGLKGRGEPGVLITLLRTRGHAPREAGAKMVVSADAAWDSIGGGNLEKTAVEHARGMLASEADAPEILDLSLTEHAPAVHGRQCCGGQVSVLFERLAAAPVVAIFGLGHVGYEAARIFSRMPISLHLVDSREEHALQAEAEDIRSGQALVSIHHAPAPETVIRSLPAGAHVLIMTHDHAEDLFLCEAVLGREDLASVGLIGSAAKWARFRKRLGESGYSAEQIARIECPLGIAEIPGKDPASIAVGVAAKFLRRNDPAQL